MNRIILLLTALVFLSAGPIRAAIDDAKDLGKTQTTEDLGNKDKKSDSDKDKKSDKSKKSAKKNASKKSKKVKKAVKDVKDIVK